MKPIIFVRIADMKYYRGITEEDQPCHGGSFVKETGYAHEECNFLPIWLEDETEQSCLGFAMLTSASKTKAPELHFENINGCSTMKKCDKLEDAIVVFCSRPRGNWTTRIAGFYKHATIYRYAQHVEFDNGDYQEFNFKAKASDCVLLPYEERRCNNKWMVPKSGENGYNFGFGHSNLWYAKNANENEELRKYVENVIEMVENYDGENLVEGWY